MWIFAPKMQTEAEQSNRSGRCRRAASWSFLLGELEESVGQVSQPMMDARNLDRGNKRKGIVGVWTRACKLETFLIGRQGVWRMVVRGKAGEVVHEILNLSARWLDLWHSEEH